MRARHFVLAAVLMLLMLDACAAPATLPTSNATPIPTLAPLVESQRFAIARPTVASVSLTLPTHMPSARAGQALYEANCAKCHGEDGRGAVPSARNFTDTDYMRGESPANFFTTVSEGRGEMPAFKATLSPDDRWNVVFYVWRFSTTDPALAQGKQIFAANCAACHGSNGTGTVLGAADFTSMTFMASSAPRDFYQIVTQGKGSMPSWQGRLSQDKRWAVIDFIHTFIYDPALPGQAPATKAAPAETATIEAACNVFQSNPFKWDDAAAVAAGKAIFEENCILCHGSDGKGTLPGAPDFTVMKAQIIKEQGKQFCVISDGHDQMPSWKDKLTTEQMWQVLTYIATLGK